MKKNICMKIYTYLVGIMNIYIYNEYIISFFHNLQIGILNQVLIILKIKFQLKVIKVLH